MKVFFFGLLICLQALAQEMCISNPVQTPMDECISDVTKILSRGLKDDSPESIEKAAVLFLEQYQNRVDFDIASAEVLAERLKRSALMETLPNSKRSRLWMLCSGVHLKLADKLRINGGLEHLMTAHSLIKKAIQLDQNNKAAIANYANGVARAASRSKLEKMYVQKKFGLNISSEVSEAMKLLEASHQTSHPDYERLKNYR